MSRTRLSLWLNRGPSIDRKVFRKVAESDGFDKNIIVPVKNGLDVIKILNRQEKHSIDHVLIAGHGGPTWLLNPRHGIVTHAIKPTQIDVFELARAISLASKDNVLVSLAACLCSRSPSWFLKLTRAIGSDWGPRGYKKGGKNSFSGKLRDYLFYYGCNVRVRGHRVSGHAANCAILAEHTSPPGSLCETFFQRSLVGIEPTLKVRHWWVKNITGELAKNWLLGDDSVESRISEMYNEWIHNQR